MPQRMPGGKAHFKFHTTQAQDLSLIKIDRRLGPGIDVEAEERTATARTPQDMIVRVKRHKRQRIESVGDGACPTDMVEVSMGIPEVGDPPASFLRGFQDQLTIPGRVYHGDVSSL